MAKSNPWEVLYKLAQGQPGTDMPVLLALDLQDQLAVAAYAQTLARE